MRYTALILASALSFAFFYVGLLISNEYGIAETKNVFVPFFIFTLFLLCLFLFLNNIYYDEAIEIKQEFDEGKAEMSIYERKYEEISKEILKKKEDIEKKRLEKSNIDIEKYLGDKLKEDNPSAIETYGGKNLGISILPETVLVEAKKRYKNETNENKKKNIIKSLKILLFKNLSVVNLHDNRKLLDAKKNKTKIKIRFNPDENDGKQINKYIEIESLFKCGDGKLSENDGDAKVSKKDLLNLDNIDIPLTLKNIYEARIDAPDQRDKIILEKVYNDVVDVYYDNMGKVFSNDLSKDIANEKMEYEISKDRLQVIKNLLDKKEKELEKDIKDKINKADNKLYQSGLEFLYDGEDNKFNYENKKSKTSSINS
jgi:hypothetical protein